MGKYDKILTLGLLILDAIYYALIKGLPAKAGRYPMFVCLLLLVLTIILAIETFLNKKPYDKKLFEGFKPSQFFFIVVVSAIYILLIDWIGFFITTLVYLIVTMVGLKAKLLYSILTSICFCVLIYLVFVIFLKVPVPSGFSI